MSCMKGKSECKETKAKFVCKKCGAATNKKSHACKPKKVKKG